MRKLRAYQIATILLAVLCVVLAYQVMTTKDKLPSKAQSEYPLLAKRIFLDQPNDTIINFSPLREDVKKYLADSGIPHSFYFEYLPTGTSIRDGEANELVGASLMKIPIVMDLYKAAEMGKVDLDKQVTVPQEAVSNDGVYGNTEQLKPGDQITLREAAKIALTESDNTAAYLVYAATKDIISADDSSIKRLDVELNETTTSSGNYVLIGARSYSSFLQCLYFSCHLSFNDSQEILGYLTESEDNNRLRAGVPSDVKVARKIGSFSDQTQSDCGIVYVPNRPYTLCLMLQVDDKNADKHFQVVSKKVYDYVTTTN